MLNTDNMSILGLTIDYGPFGFLDRYDPEHVCNTSDDSGRYSYSAQPQICRWNCMKLAEALSVRITVILYFILYYTGFCRLAELLNILVMFTVNFEGGEWILNNWS